MCNLTLQKTPSTCKVPSLQRGFTLLTRSVLIYPCPQVPLVCIAPVCASCTPKDTECSSKRSKKLKTDTRSEGPSFSVACGQKCLLLFLYSQFSNTHRVLSLNEAGSFSILALSLSLSCFSNFSHPLLFYPFLPPFLSSLSIFHHHPSPHYIPSYVTPTHPPLIPQNAELICSWLNDWIPGCQGNLVFCSRKEVEYTRR